MWLQTSGSGASFDAITAFVEANPDWPARDALLRRADESLDRSVSEDKVLAWYTAHPPTSGLGRLRQGENLARQGQERRPEEHRVGTQCGRTARCREPPYRQKKNKK